MYHWEIGIVNFRKLVFVMLSSLLKTEDNSLKVSDLSGFIWSIGADWNAYIIHINAIFGVKCAFY